jgi:hypothetical protein
MATDKQIAANRRNAKKSTGPKTLAGRTKSSCNAFRHGLTRPPTEDPTVFTEAYLLAAAIAVDEPGLQSNDAALEVALAQLTIRRVRALRNRTLSVVMATFSDSAIKHLSGFDRYERLARQGQKAAIRKTAKSRARL